MQCDLFIQEGARLGRTPAEVVSTCDITFACVSDPKAAKDVRIPSSPIMCGQENCLASLSPTPSPLPMSECLQHVGELNFPSGAIPHCEKYFCKLNQTSFDSEQRIKTRVPEICADEPCVFVLRPCSQILCLAVALFVCFHISSTVVILLN